MDLHLLCVNDERRFLHPHWHGVEGRIFGDVQGPVRVHEYPYWDHTYHCAGAKKVHTPLPVRDMLPLNYIYCGLPMPDMTEASALGLVPVLDYWVNTRTTLRYDNRAMDHASMFGHVAVLDWWLKSELEVKYTDVAHAWANNQEVWDWWAASGLPMKPLESLTVPAAIYKKNMLLYASEPHIPFYEAVHDVSLLV